MEAMKRAARHSIQHHHGKKGHHGTSEIEASGYGGKMQHNEHEGNVHGSGSASWSKSSLQMGVGVWD